MGRVLTVTLLLFGLATPLLSVDAARDFSGSWILVENRSDWRALGLEPEPFLTVTQDERGMRCQSAIGGADVAWTYSLTGAEARSRVGAEERNSLTKWEGAALLVNTLVSGPQNYTVMDRWRLSADRSILTITRQIVRPRGEVEGRLVYRRAGAQVEEAAPAPPASVTPAPPPILTPRPEPAASTPSETIVPAGTRVLLELTRPLNVGKTREGDHVYLRTAVPVAAAGRVVIPRNCPVDGTITASKSARGKPDLYIRFDSIVLPDGAAIDLRARPEGPGEGKVSGATDTGREVRTVATGGAIGASLGSIVGAASGHTLAGLGIGGIAGAAAGLGSVLSKRKDITLAAGTTVEMVLDRDLKF